VVIKVNLVGPGYGLTGEKGRGIISDPRIVRHIAEKVRAIIGFGNGADLKVIDTTFYRDRNPSLVGATSSFYYGRLERTGDDSVDEGDFCYDYNADGVLDGTSKAELVNLDSLGDDERFCTVVDEPVKGKTEVWIPKFLRTREQAHGEREYCDVYIGIPVLKSHGFTGITGALKLHYGASPGVSARAGHAGYGWGTGDIRLLLDYLCAMNRTRPFDLVVMDALTGNRQGPLNASVSTNNYDYLTDFILTNAVLCSRDSVAIDTVETLFAGYDPSSVPLLESAFRDGIGMNRPGYIALAGYDRFFRQKQFLRKQSDVGRGKYPFMDGWGNAKIHHDLSAPRVFAPEISRRAPNVYDFTYKARDAVPGDTGLSRVEIVVNGETAAFLVTDRENGVITADLRRYAGKNIQIRIAAWDKVLNCGLSEEKSLSVR
jgi:hypothetical protein